MLPPEVLKSTAEFLTRNELESLQLSNRGMKSIVERDFAVTPLRLLDQLMVLGLDSYVVSFNDEEIPCTSSSALNERFRLCLIDELSFDPTVRLDQPLLDVLLPFKELWAMGRCCTPRRFQSSQVFHAAFAQLLVCKKLFVHIPQRELFQLPSHFLALPAVAGCHCLQLLTLHYPVEEEHVVEWLHVRDAASRSRFLQVSGQIPLDASRLINVLQGNCVNATMPHAYMITMWRHALPEGATRTSNERTREEFIVNVHSNARPPVEIQRRPMRKDE